MNNIDYKSTEVFGRVITELKNYIQYLTGTNRVVFTTTDRAHKEMVKKYNEVNVSYPFASFYFYDSPKLIDTGVNTYSRKHEGKNFRTTGSATSAINVTTLAYEFYFQVDYWSSSLPAVLMSKAIVDERHNAQRYFNVNYTDDDNLKILRELPIPVFIDSFVQNYEMLDNLSEKGQQFRITYNLRLSPVYMYTINDMSNFIQRISTTVNSDKSLFNIEN